MRHHYTKQKAIIACSLMPVFWMVIYSWYGDLYTVETDDEGRLSCAPKESKITAYNRNYDFWCLLYLFIPACLLLILNIAIIIQLKRARNIHRSLTSVSYPHDRTSAKRQHSTESAVSESQDQYQSVTSVESITSTQPAAPSAVPRRLHNRDSRGQKSVSGSRPKSAQFKIR